MVAPQAQVQGLGCSSTVVPSAGSALFRPLLAWLVPDVALSAALVTFALVTLLGGATGLFRDSDAGWHIQTGEAILNTWALPYTDPYSLTHRGRPWFAWEWGADVLMGLAHRWAGLPGVLLLYATTLAALSWLWFRYCWRLGAAFLTACALCPLMVATSSFHWLARPHIFAWLLTLLTLYWIERAPLHPLLAALLGALWANMHASFFLGALILLLWPLGQWLRSRIWDAPPKRFSGLPAACFLLATFLNPYGWRLHQHVMEFLADSELTQLIGEFQTFNFYVPGALPILVTVFIAAGAIPLMIIQRRLDHALWSVLLLAAALRSARLLPLVGLALLPLAARAFTLALRRPSGLRPAVSRALESLLIYSDRLRRLDQRFHGGALAGLAFLVATCLMLTAWARAQISFPAATFPVAAAQAIASLPEEARIFASDSFGGYLIYRFAGRRPVFIDGRSDFYGLAHVKTYLRILEVRPQWKADFDRFGFTHALLYNRYSLTAALLDCGWRVRYRDALVTLLEKPHS